MSRGQGPPREDVLAVAEELFAREGARGLSVRRIADRLGVSRQIVYSRFGDKPDLVRALHAEGFGRLSARMAAVSAEEGTEARIHAMAHAYRTAALASPSMYGLMFGRAIAEFEPDDAARRVAREAFEPVVAAARAWLRRSKPRATKSARAFELAEALWAGTHGVVALELAGLLGSEGTKVLDRMVEATLAGWRTDRVTR